MHDIVLQLRLFGRMKVTPKREVNNRLSYSRNASLSVGRARGGGPGVPLGGRGHPGGLPAGAAREVQRQEQPGHRPGGRGLQRGGRIVSLYCPPL